ncbi:MAG: SDR family oxidoreductase [Cyclobacteriaceae bacterium]
MKKVLIIGASGKIGRLLTEKLNDDTEFSPVALFRSEDQKDFFEKLGVEYKIISLEDSIDVIFNAMVSTDAIIFTAGSGGKTGYDKTLAIDLDGAVKAMDAAEQAGVKRFVMVSALNTDKREAWNDSGIKPYYIAKHYADRVLKSSDLDYTIMRPGRLVDDAGTGKITTTNPAANKSVPREDVASLIVEVLKQDDTIGRVIEFNQGDTPIQEAIKGI